MADLNSEKIYIRKQIISAADIYKEELAGRVYLYVYGDSCLEVAYMTECFKHLTGIESNLTGRSFYENAKNGTLSTGQISFSSRHPLKTAKKKLKCLNQLPQLTRNLVCVVQDMYTMTLTYKLGITNLEFTIGLTEFADRSGHKRNNWFVPRTLRINDKAIDTAKDAEFVSFIFSKKATEEQYDEVCYADGVIPEWVRPLLSDRLLSSMDIENKLQTV